MEYSAANRDVILAKSKIALCKLCEVQLRPREKRWRLCTA